MTIELGSTLAVSDAQKFFSTIYQEYKRLMFLSAGKYVSNFSDQEDIVQIALEKLIENYSKLKTLDRCALSTYIVYTVRSVAIDHIRKQKRIGFHIVSMEDYMTEESEPIDTSFAIYEKALENKELINMLWSNLSDEDRILLEGKYVWELADKELAKMLDCKPGSIRMKLTRARRRALSKLEERERSEV